MGKDDLIYILKCKDEYCVELITDNSHDTSYDKYKPKAIYRVDKLDKFMFYNKGVIDIINGDEEEHIYYRGMPNLLYVLKNWNVGSDYLYDLIKNVENNVVECMKIHKKDEHNKIRGGYYTKIDHKYPLPNNLYMEYLPLCKCGLPCNVDLKNSFFYFECPKVKFKVGDSCDFYQEYTLDEEFRKKRRSKYDDLIPKTKIIK